MDIIFSLIGILFLLAILAGFVFIAIFIARKIGLIAKSAVNEIGTEQGTVKSYLADLKHLNQSLIFRFGIISLLVVLMNSPLSMVSDVVDERNQLYSEVLYGIANTWGHTQKLQGPALLIPYTEKFTTIKILTDKDGNERKVNNTTYEHHTAIILPEDLKIDADLLSKTLNRGIYNALVYTADLSVTGSFQRPDIASLSNHLDEIHWDRAWLTLGISS